MPTSADHGITSCINAAEIHQAFRFLCILHTAQREPPGGVTASATYFGQLLQQLASSCVTAGS
jgi:hypothetical protein